MLCWTSGDFVVAQDDHHLTLVSASPVRAENAESDYKREPRENNEILQFDSIAF